MQSRSRAKMIAVALAAAVLLSSGPAPVVASTGLARRGETSVTPVQKVIELMEGMLRKGKTEKRKEQARYAEYKQFCDNTGADKKRAITTATEQIEILTADIRKYEAKATQMSRDISKLEKHVDGWTADKNAATKVRNGEKSDYDAMHKDYTESINALDGAITTLKTVPKENKQAAFEQVASLRSLPLVPDETKQAISSFMQGTETDLTRQAAAYLAGPKAPVAAAYESSSNSIVKMLEGLLDKFVAQRTDLEKEELTAKNAFEQLAKDLDNQIEQANSDIDDNNEAKSKALQSKASATGDLEDTSTSKAADETYLEDMVATCEQKASDFASRQQLRAEELEAINKAIEIISSGAVKGSAEKHLPSFSQFAEAPALVSLRAAARASSTMDSVVEMLRSRAQELDSSVLTALVQRMSSGADPFAKVIKMVQDLITRLVDKANEEADHKEWCDKELPANEKTRKGKSEEVETLTAEIDQLKSSIAKLIEEVSDLTDAVAELDKAMSEATKLRNEEQTKNEQAVEDAEAAQEACAQALVVLKDFYAKASDATAFVQQSKAQPEAPDIFDKPYQGMGGEGGVVGMLEVIESDFARLESDTKSSEASAQKEYDTFMRDSRKDKGAKSLDIDHKATKEQYQSTTLVTKKKDLESTQNELDAALQYFDKLKASCIDEKVDYEERVKRRKEEIQSLKEALEVLNQNDQ